MEHLLEKKHFTTDRGFTYAYYVSPAGTDAGSVPPLLFLHGFPDNALLWKYVIERLSKLSYRFIVPDLLGFGESSKPLDLEHYVWKDVQNDIVVLLKAENTEKVIVVGHDWGSILGQRLYFHNPHVVAGLVMVAVGYIAPLRHKFDLDFMNQLTQKKLGLDGYAYIEFLTADDTPELVRKYPEKFWEAFHGAPSDWVAKMLCTKGAIRKYLEGNESVPLKPYAQDPKIKGDFLERAPKEDMKSSFQWHKILLSEHALEPEEVVPPERARVTVPALSILSSEDLINPPEIMEKHREEGTFTDLEIHTLETGHWSPWESPDELSDLIREWTVRRFVST